MSVSARGCPVLVNKVNICLIRPFWAPKKRNTHKSEPPAHRKCHEDLSSNFYSGRERERNLICILKCKWALEELTAVWACSFRCFLLIGWLWFWSVAFRKQKWNHHRSWRVGLGSGLDPDTESESRNAKEVKGFGPGKCLKSNVKSTLTWRLVNRPNLARPGTDLLSALLTSSCTGKTHYNYVNIKVWQNILYKIYISASHDIGYFLLQLSVFIIMIINSKIHTCWNISIIIYRI